MRCPHCQTEYFEEWSRSYVQTEGQPLMKGGAYDGQRANFTIAVATCPKCRGPKIELTAYEPVMEPMVYQVIPVFPRGGPFSPAPVEVPASIASDYAEANEVLPISAKASAALSRRCLQAMLSAHGYSGRDLVKQVDAVLSEADASKALPTSLRENIDAIRNFGNFSAHPVTDQTTLQIVEVEEGEAEWCLQLLLDLFDHYYVSPARAAQKRAALGAKLAAAGKPPMKGK